MASIWLVKAGPCKGVHELTFYRDVVELRDLTTNRNTQEPVTPGSLCTFSPEGGRGRLYFQNLINYKKGAALWVEKQNPCHTEVCMKELGEKILGFSYPSFPHYNFVIPIGPESTGDIGYRSQPPRSQLTLRGQWRESSPFRIYVHSYHLLISGLYELGILPTSQIYIGKN